MTRRIILVGLACSLLASSTGCGLLCCLFRPGLVCDPQHCPPGEGPACAPIAGGACVPGCAPVCEPACAPVCEPACGPACPPPCEPPCGPACGPAGDPYGGAPYARHCGPLTWIFGLFCGGCWYGSGCGERYWGDFCGDPPDCCDPCDGWGNYTGGRVGGYHYEGHAPNTLSPGTGVEPAPEIIQPPEAIRQ